MRRQYYSLRGGPGRAVCAQWLISLNLQAQAERFLNSQTRGFHKTPPCLVFLYIWSGPPLECRARRTARFSGPSCQILISLKCPFGVMNPVCAAPESKERGKCRVMCVVGSKENKQ